MFSLTISLFSYQTCRRMRSTHFKGMKWFWNRDLMTVPKDCSLKGMSGIGVGSPTWLPSAHAPTVYRIDGIEKKTVKLLRAGTVWSLTGCVGLIMSLRCAVVEELRGDCGESREVDIKREGVIYICTRQGRGMNGICCFWGAQCEIVYNYPANRWGYILCRHTHNPYARIHTQAPA